MKLIYISFLFVIVLPVKLIAQQDSVKRTIGLSAVVQSNEFGVNVPIWINDRFVLAPSLGFSIAEAAGSELSVGATAKAYLSTGKQLMPYFALRAGSIITTPPTESVSKENSIDLFLGLGFGGEYFLAPNFSFGVEAQGNFTKSDETSTLFGNPGGNNFNLATIITANIYFTRER